MIQKKNVQQKENIRPEEKKTYNVVDTKKISLGRFSIIKDSVEKAGEIYPYSYISMKDSVSILPFVDKKLLLIKQYRHSLKKWIYEIPGGAVDQGESVLEAAKRELLEETGYQVKRIRGLGFYYPSPGASTEKAYLYVAWCGNRPEPSELEPLELLTKEVVSTSQFENMILENQILQGMALVAWQRYQMCRGDK